MAATTTRARSAEKALQGKELSQAAVAAAVKALHEDFKPVSDWRASADYRLAAAEGLLQRLYLKLGAAAVPLEIDAL